MRANWCWSHGVSAAVHVSLLGLLSGGAAWVDPARAPGQREIRVAWTVEAAAAPPVTIAPQAAPVTPVRRQPQVADAAEEPAERMAFSEMPSLPASRATNAPADVNRSADAPAVVRRQRNAPPAPASVASLPAALGQITAARPVSNPPPEYPPEALSARWQGDVILKVTIAASGRVRSVRLLRGSGHAVLDQAAIDAVRGWRFDPARRHGRPIEWTAKLPIQFRLK